MPLRFSLESRMTAAFLAGALMLAVAAWLAISTARDYVAAEQRVGELLQTGDVLSRLSSTIEAETPATPATPTSIVPAALARAAAERDALRRRLDVVERVAALLAALSIAVYGFGYSALLRALRERKGLAGRLQAELHHDALTGLPNRRFFTEWLSFAIAHARRERGHVGVLFIDISGCAAVAELHGGPATEALLVEVARRFRAASREGDVFARLGASEFALATPNAHGTRELAILAQRLRDALNDPAQPPLADTPVGTSIGIAFFPEDADDSAGVMAAANAAMYAARRAGHDHVAFNALAA
jgi:diguanylate cyclase (GGDEF)-like protein